MGSFAEKGSATFGQPPQQPDSASTNEREYTDRAQRRRVIKGVRISFQNDYCAVEGVMKNVSDTGALVELKDGYLIPDTITIYDELAGYKVEANVVRRNTNRIGIQFVGEKQPIEQKRAQIVAEIGGEGQQSLAEPEPETDPEAEAQPEREEQVPDRYPMGSGPSLRKKPVFGKLGNN